MHQSQFTRRTLEGYKSASHEKCLTKSESILLFVTDITALNKMILYTFTSYLPHSQSQAVPALPGQNSMPIGWGNLGHLFYWLKIPQICCCYKWGCLEPRWGRKVPQLIPQNFKHPDFSLMINCLNKMRFGDFLGSPCYSHLKGGYADPDLCPHQIVSVSSEG